MASPTVCWIDATGIHAPSFNDVLSYLKAQYQTIYGSDVYLENDSQDGQLLALFATALNDANAAMIAVYNSFSPATAQGVGLSSVVKINGIARNVPTKSVVDLLLVGVAGTQINNGIVTDANNTRWFLPAVVTIPANGQISVTATAEFAGAVTAGANTVNKIATPTRGWQTVNNVLDATAGAPLESDAALRRRQGFSTMLPSVTALEGMIGAVQAVPGVTRFQVYENDTDIPDAHGIPSHSLAFVVEGGDTTTIALAIASKKTPGAGTFGTTAVTLADVFGVPHTIRFFRPTPVTINVSISVAPLLGYTTSAAQDIATAIANYINTGEIGSDVSYSKLFVPANLTGTEATTFNIKQLLLSRAGGALAATDVALAFNEVAVCSTANVTVNVG